MQRSRAFLTVLLSTLVIPLQAWNLQAQVTSPQEQFGHMVGADYELVNYAELQAYWQKLASESNRMVLDTIGYTQEGRPQLMAIITSPQNHSNLARYKEIARRMALAEGVSEAEARALAQEGKAVVWIDGGLHATEVLGAQQLLELVYRMTSADDPETLRILDDIILLAVHCNPDGMDLVSNWYHRNDAQGIAPEERSTSGVPVLYHYYAGHDNNRDFYMANLVETTNMLRVQYREWFPQIIYNHHQTGPRGTIMFAPPYRNPPNHFLDPLIMTSIDQVGSAMHQRFVQEGKGGTTMRSGANYSIWWNGGLRTTPYFHNAIGLLTETQGSPNPLEIPFVPERQLATTDLPLPVEPGILHFRTVIEYSQTANWAVMDYASRNKDLLLFNIWRMGANSIEKGSRDSWTVKAGEIYQAGEEMGGVSASGSAADFERFLKDPGKRDPRGFVIPSDQADFPTAVAFANTLIKNGVTVHRATAAFTVGAVEYPAGSIVVKTDQAYRPHVLDMFEPQDHPNDFAYPGGPPIPPYDATGWTLALQMGVEFHRVLDGFDGPFQVVDDVMDTPQGAIFTPYGGQPVGYLLSHEVNNAFSAIYSLLGAGAEVYWIADPFTVDGTPYPEGTYWIPVGSETPGQMARLTRELGVTFVGASAAPRGQALQLRQPRIGLWDQYGGSMPSGWVRFILDQFGFEFQLVFPPDLDAGNLGDRFDVIILPDGAVPGVRPGGGGGYGGRGGSGPDPETIPPEYRARMGRVTPETTVPQLRAFLEGGGTIITMEGSTDLAYHLGLAVRDFLVDENGTPFRSEEFFVPGSLLEVERQGDSPVTHGMKDAFIVNFARSPVFAVEPGAAGIRPLAVYTDRTPLRSGWAWGQEKLQGGVAMAEATVGEGTLYLFGPQITFRGQPHETFPLLFNGIFLSRAVPRTLE